MPRHAQKTRCRTSHPDSGWCWEHWTHNEFEQQGQALWCLSCSEIPWGKHEDIWKIRFIYIYIHTYIQRCNTIEGLPPLPPTPEEWSCGHVSKLNVHKDSSVLRTFRLSSFTYVDLYEIYSRRFATATARTASLGSRS